MSSQENNFYIYLPSNVNTKNQYPNNTTSNFITPLADPLVLDTENWEVALAEIFFPNYNYNVTETMTGDITLAFYLGNHRETYALKLTEGFYTPDTFVRNVNKEISKFKSYVHNMKVYKEPYKGKLKYNPQSKKISMIFHRGESMRVENIVLRRMMGYREGDKAQYGHAKSNLLEAPVISLTLPFPCAFNVNGTHMYVYSDIVNYSQVGCLYAPVMRVVPLDVGNQHRETIHRDYQKPHYMSLRSNVIRSINIVLCNDKGEEIKFRQGNSILVLHFRKKPLLKSLG